MWVNKWIEPSTLITYHNDSPSTPTPMSLGDIHTGIPLAVDPHVVY
jgi:hypothetical protein